MTDPVAPNRKPPPPKPGDPTFKTTHRNESLRHLLTVQTYLPGFEKQHATLTERMTVIQFSEPEESNQQLEIFHEDFDEAFAYCLASNQTVGKRKAAIESLRLHNNNLETFLNSKSLPSDPFIKRLQNINNLALEHLERNHPIVDKRASLQRSSSSGLESPDPSEIARRRQDSDIPETPADYEKWLLQLKQNPISDDLLSNYGDFDGTLAYCLASHRTLEERAHDLEQFTGALSSSTNPHLQRVEKICNRAIVFLRNPPAPVPVRPEIPSEDNKNSWNTRKIAIVIGFALGSIGLLFLAYKHRKQLKLTNFNIKSLFKT